MAFPGSHFEWLVALHGVAAREEGLVWLASGRLIAAGSRKRAQLRFTVIAGSACTSGLAWLLAVGRQRFRRGFRCGVSCAFYAAARSSVYRLAFIVMVFAA